jgi:hypothetical protein
VGSTSKRHLHVFRNRNGGWEELLEIGDGPPDPFVQTLPQGGVLVAGGTSRRLPDGAAEPNAAVYSAAGLEVARFSVGDGVEDVQTAPSGVIWASYNYLGAMGDYGRHGWGRIDPQLWIEPIGGEGVLCFSSSGDVVGRPVLPRGAGPVLDCYALNVDGEDAWISYHPGFPVVHLGGQQPELWRSTLWGVDAIAVADGRVAVHRLVRSGEAWYEARLGATGELAHVSRFEPAFAHGSPGRVDHIAGRGSKLHVLANRRWYVLDIDAGRSL